MNALTSDSRPADVLQDFCGRLGAQGIATMASGGRAPLYRFYFHARPAGGQQPVLAEVLVDKTAGSASVTVKCADARLMQPFSDMFRRCLDSLT